MNLNPETQVHDDMFDIKYRPLDTLHKTMLFEPIRQKIVSHAMFQVTRFVDLGSYIKSFGSLEDYIYQLRDQLMNVVTNPRHKFEEEYLSK